MKGMYEKNAKSALVIGHDATMKDLLRQHVTYFAKLKGKLDKYYWTFLGCQLLNICMLSLNFYINNEFLDGNFATYGSDVIHYHSFNRLQRSRVYNPMCNAFPTQVNIDSQKKYSHTETRKNMNLLYFIRMY